MGVKVKVVRVLLGSPISSLVQYHFVISLLVPFYNFSSQENDFFGFEVELGFWGGTKILGVLISVRIFARVM